MGLLTTTIATGTAHIIEPPIVNAGAKEATAAVKASKQKSKTTAQTLNTQTMADIGIEPGSITWLS